MHYSHVAGVVLLVGSVSCTHTPSVFTENSWELYKANFPKQAKAIELVSKIRKQDKAMQITRSILNEGISQGDNDRTNNDIYKYCEVSIKENMSYSELVIGSFKSDIDLWRKASSSPSETESLLKICSLPTGTPKENEALANRLIELYLKAIKQLEALST